MPHTEAEGLRGKQNTVLGETLAFSSKIILVHGGFMGSISVPPCIWRMEL